MDLDDRAATGPTSDDASESNAIQENLRRREYSLEERGGHPVRMRASPGAAQ
jgi:hypothetical protein